MSTEVTPIETSDATPVPAEGIPGETLSHYFRRWWVGVRSGDLGSLPIVAGLVVIAIIFQTLNSHFLTAGNFVNLIVQAAAVTTIAMGIVFVLLLGEIDLSVGYVSGVAGVIVALLTIPDGSHEFAAIPAIIIGLLAGLGIGLLQGGLITKVNIPSFVVTLAGLLAWNGVVLLLIGDRGTVVIQDDLIINFANGFISDAAAWVIVIAIALVYSGTLLYQRHERRKANLPLDPDALLVLRVAFLTILAAAVVYVANKDRGVPYVFLVLAVLYIVWTFVLSRTRFGRHVYAVGGNQEAARRAGINVDRVKMACFGICSMMAALGGVVLASRLRSVDTAAGGGSILLYSIAAAVIGGTSLFGGRGHIKSAVLGALVIASIDNGLGLQGYSQGVKYVVTGLVLLAAVTVDSLSRRGRAASGRA